MFRLFIVLVSLLMCSQAAVIKRSSTYEGMATYYLVNKSGHPSCGGRYDSNAMVVALSHKRMQGRNNPCGERIKVYGDYGSVIAEVVDTCAGCDKDDIDLSPKAFEKLGQMREGKLEIEWSFKY